jgi:hypothetical protein
MMVRTYPMAAISRHSAAIFLIILFAAAARFLLILNLPIRFLPNDVHADGLFMRLAASLASGVSDSNQSPVTNRLGYPLFLAITHLSGLPLSAAHALFQTVAISAAAWAVFRLTRSQWGAVAIFIALAFCPAGITMQRVLPDQIYWAQILLAFSLFAIILFAPLPGRCSAMVVTGLAGLILGWGSLTGEHSVWFLLAFALLSVGAILTAQHSREELLTLTRNLCVASAGVVVVNVAALTANLNVHGSLVGVDVLPRMTNIQWSSLPRTLVAAAETVWHPDLTTTTPFCSVSVESDEFRRFWIFLNKPHVWAVQPNREVAALGWYYDSQSIEWPIFMAYTPDGQEVPLSVMRQPSPDLQRHFFDDRASYDRFEIKFRGPDVCVVAARASDGPELRVVLDPQEGRAAFSGSALFNVDRVSDSAGGLVDPGTKLAGSVSLSLVLLYEGLLPFLLPIGLIAAGAASWRAFSRQSLPRMLLTALAAWILAATGTVLLALIDSGALPAATIHYSAPANYMAIVAACLSLTVLSVASRPD